MYPFIAVNDPMYPTASIPVAEKSFAQFEPEDVTD
jgi:hypothetical protein